MKMDAIAKPNIINIKIIVIILLLTLAFPIMAGSTANAQTTDPISHIANIEAIALERFHLQQSNPELSDNEKANPLFSKQITHEIKARIKNKTGYDLAFNEYLYEIKSETLGFEGGDIFLYIKDRDIMIFLSQEEYGALNNTKAIWFWCNQADQSEFKYITNPAERVKALDMLESQGINTIYLATHIPYIHQYEHFVRDAYNRNMTVYALAGDPDFINEDIREQTTRGYIDQIYAYNLSVEHDAKFKGIHYDVEPYSNGRWINGETETARRGIVRTLFVDFVKMARAYSRDKNLLMEYDLPVWLDRYSYYDDDNQLKNWGEEIFKLADQVTFMNYQPNANNIFIGLINNGEFHHGVDPEGVNITVERSWYERASLYKKNIVIGVDIHTFKAEAEAKVARPELVPTYIAPDYEYSISYINDKILSATSEKIETYQAIKNLSFNYSYSFHQIYTLMDLLSIEK